MYGPGGAAQTREEVYKAIRLIKEGTAVGVDHWSPSNLRKLDSEGCQALADLYNKIEKGYAWQEVVKLLQ